MKLSQPSFHPCAGLLAGVLVALLVNGQAQAQVHKCTDATGKTTFSDSPCPTSAKSSARVLGADATDRRWENEAYGRERNMRSIENASRIIQEPTSDVQVGSPAAVGGTPRAQVEQSPSPTAAAPVHPDDLSCDTVSPRKGCVGGSRTANPNWAPRRGYFGGGGPADQRYAEEQERARAIAAQSSPKQVSRCDATGCWDVSGTRYTRTGSGQNFFRADGRFCQAQGSTIACN